MLFKTITEIKEFLPIAVGNDFNRLKPHITNAENAYIKPLLGTNMYDELDEFYTGYPYDNPNEGQEATEKLLKKVQHSLIHLAYYVGFHFLSVSASDMGFTRSESQTTKGLYRYQEDNLLDYFSDSGFNGLDDVLVFLESNITHFTGFKSTENWTELKESFLPTVKVIEKIPFNIHGSRLTFLNLKPHIFYIEDTEVKKVLGETIYDYIKEEMVKDSPTEKVVKILPYIRKPLIYLASSLFMQETGATLGDKGLFFEKTESNAQSNRTKQPTEASRVYQMVTRNQDIGVGYIQALKKYMVKNVADWPDYSGQTGSAFNRDNTDKKTFWA